MIDSDLSTAGKPIVKEYLEKKYGKECVLSVGTYSTIGLLSGLKDILRKLGVDFKTSNLFCENFSEDFSWEENVERLKDKKDLYELYLKYKDSFDMTPKIMNKIRQSGKHAGGVLILPKPVYNYIPVMRVGGSSDNSEYVSAFVEAGQSTELDDFTGVVKLDILGITVLDVIDNTIDLIEEDLYEIEEDDVKKIVPKSYLIDKGIEL